MSLPQIRLVMKVGSQEDDRVFRRLVVIHVEHALPSQRSAWNVGLKIYFQVQSSLGLKPGVPDTLDGLLAA